MKKIFSPLILGLFSLMLSNLSFAYVQSFNPLVDCPALAMPKTVLLVHASWCSHCQSFMPTYKAISEQEKYRDWVFYAMVNDKFEKVCGKSIWGVPITFKNNLQSSLSGNRNQAALEKFLDQ